jgi:multimeric flavodoxin WrbA
MRSQFNTDNILRTITHLQGKRVLLIATSTRWEGDRELPKSTRLAHIVKDHLGESAHLIDASKLHIYQCEGNVSKSGGNNCGDKTSVLKDPEKNPSGCHRCWASFNHKDDELWRISRELLQSQAVIFFGSVRWGSANGIYQKLIERLSWLNNRHSTLGEDNIIKDIEAGVIFTGHNWNGSSAIELQKQVLEFYGFQVPQELSWNWQWTSDANDESAEGYLQDPKDFEARFGDFEKLQESFEKWKIK